MPTPDTAALASEPEDRCANCRWAYRPSLASSGTVTLPGRIKCAVPLPPHVAGVLYPEVPSNYWCVLHERA